MTFEMGFLIVGLMQVVGFFVEGTAGFGCTVIAAPVTNGILGTTVGVPYGTIIAIPFLYALAYKERKGVSWKDLGKILVLCAPGIFVGQKLFYKISPDTAKICIGTIVTLIAVMNIHKHIIKPLVLKEENKEDTTDTMFNKVFRYTCLVLGGVVHGAFTIGGPLITVYTLQAVKDRRKFRNTMEALWCVLNTWNVITQYRNGAFTSYTMSAVLVGLPLAAIGYITGVRFLEKINREQFLRIVYLILLAIGTNMLRSTISWTPQTIKGAIVAFSFVITGYIFMIMKKISSNKKFLERA